MKPVNYIFVKIDEERGGRCGGREECWREQGTERNMAVFLHLYLSNSEILFNFFRNTHLRGEYGEDKRGNL